MRNKLLNMNQVILIGAAGQNCGKTTLASELIKKWHAEFPVIALKITTIERKNGKCIRNNHRCGVCTNINGNFELLEEVCRDRNKDTSILLASGAQKVYWLKCLSTHLEEGIRFFMRQIPENTIVICESNSLRNIVNPSLFIMLKNPQSTGIKPSAAAVMDKADIILENDFQDSIRKLADRITIDNSGSEMAISIENETEGLTKS